MKVSKKQVVLGFGALLLGGALIAPPAANAGGSSGAYNGCYAQWYNTYTAGRCFDTTGSNKRLIVDCSWGGMHYLSWHFISGTDNPFDDYECNYGVNTGVVEQSN